MDVHEFHKSHGINDWWPRFVHLPSCRQRATVLTHDAAVGVPGELRGWELLHQKHGKLPWEKLFEGAINLARYGFTVNHDLASLLNNSEFICVSKLAEII